MTAGQCNAGLFQGMNKEIEVRMNLFEEFRRSIGPITIDGPGPEIPGIETRKTLRALMDWTTMTKDRVPERLGKDLKGKEALEGCSPDPDGLSFSTSNF